MWLSTLVSIKAGPINSRKRTKHCWGRWPLTSSPGKANLNDNSQRSFRADQRSFRTYQRPFRADQRFLGLMTALSGWSAVLSGKDFRARPTVTISYLGFWPACGSRMMRLFCYVVISKNSKNQPYLNPMRTAPNFCFFSVPTFRGQITWLEPFCLKGLTIEGYGLYDSSTKKEGGVTTYSRKWLTHTVYETNITNPKPKPIRFAQSTICWR